MPWYGWLIWGALQVCVMVWVWSVVKRVLPPDTAAGDENKTEKLLSLYQRIEEMLDSFEEFVGETHARLDERRTELIELNRQAHVVYMQALEMSKQATALIPMPAPVPPDDPDMPASNGASPKGGVTADGSPGHALGVPPKGGALSKGDALPKGGALSKGDAATSKSAAAKESAASKGGAVIKAQEFAPSAKSSRLTDLDKEALGRFVTKPQKVRFLMSRGLSLEEVARELDIGKGEVILIADLDKS